MTKLTVNNQPIQYRMDPQTPLLWAIRDGSNLAGTKYGCGTGDCGACTVDVDGKAVRSCQMTLASMEGAFVTTIEGLSRDRSHPVQQAWAQERVPQCGYCQSGMIMAAAALLKVNANPTDDEINAATAFGSLGVTRASPVAIGLMMKARSQARKKKSCGQKVSQRM